MTREINLDEDFDPLPLMVDGRTPEELMADGDNRWPDGSRYTPPHLSGEEREQFVRQQDEIEKGIGP